MVANIQASRDQVKACEAGVNARMVWRRVKLMVRPKDYSLTDPQSYARALLRPLAWATSFASAHYRTVLPSHRKVRWPD